MEGQRIRTRSSTETWSPLHTFPHRGASSPLTFSLACPKMRLEGKLPSYQQLNVSECALRRRCTEEDPALP